jgi:hypothetical protein
VDDPQAPRPFQIAPARAAASVSTPFPAPGLAARVDAWASSSDPHDALQACEAVQRCLQARRDDRTPDDVLNVVDAEIESAVGVERMDRLRAQRHHAAQWCDDLRSDQIQGRLAWLERAAAAGEPGAASSFIVEGPDGQGMLEDGGSKGAATPEWFARRDAYIEAALRHCDQFLPSELGLSARPPTVSMADAMSFWMARQECDKNAAPRPALSDDPVAVDYLGYMGRGRPLPPVEGVMP